MKIVKISIELGIDDISCGNSKEDVAHYLNTMLYKDPEFFGDFGPENIVSIGEFE